MTEEDKYIYIFVNLKSGNSCTGYVRADSITDFFDRISDAEWFKMYHRHPENEKLGDELTQEIKYVRPEAAEVIEP